MKEMISVRWIKKQIDDLYKLRTESRPIFFTVIGIIAILLIWLFSNWYYIPHLKKEIYSLKDTVDDRDKQISSLETRLVPFRTVALEKFSGYSENEALSALAERIGQIELQIFSLFDYQEISTWTFTGNLVKKLGDAVSTTGKSPAFDWSKNYIQINDKGEFENIDCGIDAIKQYLGTIQRFELFPFPYYILAKCQQKNNDPEWQVNFGKAYKILSTTTKIPGHHLDHEAILNQMTHEY